jgi:hypothetical protein
MFSHLESVVTLFWMVIRLSYQKHGSIPRKARLHSSSLPPLIGKPMVSWRCSIKSLNHVLVERDMFQNYIINYAEVLPWCLVDDLILTNTNHTVGHGIICSISISQINPGRLQVKFGKRNSMHVMFGRSFAVQFHSICVAILSKILFTIIPY